MGTTNPFEVIEARLIENSERLDKIIALLKVPEIPVLSERITDIDEACRVIGGEKTPYSRAWMYAHCTNGDVPTHKNGNRLVWLRSELEQYRDARIARRQYPDEIVSQAIATSASKKFKHVRA